MDFMLKLLGFMLRMLDFMLKLLGFMLRMLDFMLKLLGFMLNNGRFHTNVDVLWE